MHGPGDSCAAQGLEDGGGDSLLATKAGTKLGSTWVS